MKSHRVMLGYNETTLNVKVFIRKMTNTAKLIAVGWCVGLLSVGALVDKAWAEDECSFGHRQRVAVYQAGAYADFQKVFRQTALALQRDGYINAKVPLSIIYTHDTAGAYAALSEASQGGCIEFVKDGLYDGNWEPALIDAKEQALRERIRKVGDIDMVWALGSIAGQRFADSSLHTNVLVMTATDPESAGIIGPGEYSDKPFIHAQKERDRYSSELRMFYQIFHFKRLGIIIDDEESNHAGQAVPVIRDVARDLGFALNTCQKDVISADAKVAHEAFAQCCLELAENSDAVYLPYGMGADLNNLYSQLKPLIDAKIPTFSQTGALEVENGVLLSLADIELIESGRFEANVVEEIVHGKKPEEISQYYFAPLNLALNLHTAKLIEWKPDFDVLIAVDRVYQSIDSMLSH